MQPLAKEVDELVRKVDCKICYTERCFTISIHVTLHSSVRNNRVNDVILFRLLIEKSEV
jgi:hypothetical protein